ncbi:MAG: peptidylprolyl isomerase, partial [Bdellovibrionia bacterium]
LLMIFGILIAGLIGAAVIYTQKIMPSSSVPIVESATKSTVNTPAVSPSPAISPSELPSPDLKGEILPSPSVSASPGPSLAPDLSVDSAGLSKATVVMITSAGTIKFKFYPNDARQTVDRIIELIGKGFYNGLTFHRVVPGFVIQGGDPVGNGTGGSGQKLKAEFSNRRHVEGTLAMARAADPNSADSQFYICLGTLQHLDHNYTVFGQVVEGMDVARMIKAGDKMLSFSIQ